MAEITIRIPDKAIKIAAVVVGAVVLALLLAGYGRPAFFVLTMSCRSSFRR